MTTYDVTADFTADGWMIRMEGVGAALAKTYDDVEVVAVALITEGAGVEVSSVDLRVEWLLPADVAEAIDAAEKFRREEAEAHEAAMAQTRLAARLLRDLGMSGRDAARVLDVSKSRVYQLVAEEES